MQQREVLWLQKIHKRLKKEKKRKKKENFLKMTPSVQVENNSSLHDRSWRKKGERKKYT